MAEKKRKSVIYLAGPMSGCNPRQMTDWRERLRHDFAGDFEFIDPADPEHLVTEGDPASATEIVHRDQEAIARADGVLANMWKESVGTAIGIAYARGQGIPVVVADPNHLGNRVLAYYADAVVTRPAEGMRTLRDIFRAQSRIKAVVKSGGKEQPFDRRKLVASIRKAAQAAGRNDLLAPAAIVPRVMETLAVAPTSIQGAITTTAIKEAVWTVLRDLEADPLRHGDFTGIREAWERHDLDRRPFRARVQAAPRTGVVVHPRPLSVPVAANKAHGTVWGKTVKRLKDLPGPARYLFQEICKVDGIAEIRLTGMSEGPPVAGAKADILASKVAGVIEGKCFTQGVKGRVQMFQIRVHDGSRTDAIREALIGHLGGLRLLRVERSEAA